MWLEAARWAFHVLCGDRLAAVTYSPFTLAASPAIATREGWSLKNYRDTDAFWPIVQS